MRVEYATHRFATRDDGVDDIARAYEIHGPECQFH